MFEIFAISKKRIFLFCLLLSGVSFCWAGQSSTNSVGAVGAGDKTGIPNAIEGIWDPDKYISIDEIKPGMEAYCLTGYKGTEIEKFGLEVISVVRNVEPGRDAILVQGTDERFIRTGPVWGCSGSPVYIDGRLAGALAFAWPFSKDPLYGVTPIKEMLSVGAVSRSQQSQRQRGFVFDFSAPIDFARIEKQMFDSRYSKLDSRTSIQHRASSIEWLPCPLIISGLPARVRQQLNASVEPFGLMVVSGIAGGSSLLVTHNSSLESRDTPHGSGDPKLAPGAALAIPLVTGDITMTVIGTVTEVAGDRVYGFGHSFLGYGPVDLPMATAQVHTVVSSVARSFKFASVLEIVGALTMDESAAILGRIGAKARMIPLTIRIDRYNDPETRVYNCQVADNRLLTPLVLRSAVAGAALYLGSFPPDHMIDYKVTIGVEDAEAITFENVSTSVGLAEVTTESVSSVALLMNNPYEKVDIKSIDFDVRIMPKNISSHIWSVDLSDSKVKAGQQIELGVVVESPLSQKKKYQCSLKVPDELAPGKYDLIVCGGYGYQEFLKNAAPYKFVPQSLTTLVEAINSLLAIKRDKLYCLLVLPPGGVAVEKAELPDLPATKALVLQDAKRTLRTQPFSRWLEKTFRTGTVCLDKKVMHITVEK